MLYKVIVSVIVQIEIISRILAQHEKTVDICSNLYVGLKTV